MKCPCVGMFLILLVLVSVSVEAQSLLFRPFTSFRVIRTERFDIIFPAESEPSARMLASYADRVYGELSSLLGIEIPFRIPVVLNPHTDLFNAFYSMFPTPHIMLFDTPMDIEFTTFYDNLKDLFVHELTHAISLNARGPFNRFVYRLFGNMMFTSPVMLRAPLFMVEGVAVSFESLSGFGRVNDPLVRQNVKQAFHENMILSRLSAMHLYEYGGLFSAWLKETHGLEKYARLWQEMGRGFMFWPGFRRVFRNVYNMSLDDAMEAFRDSFDLGHLEENPDEVFPRSYHFFSERRNFIGQLTTHGNNLFVLDGVGSAVHVHNTIAGTTRSLSLDVLGAYDLDVSADGTTMLVSGYRFVGDRFEAVVTEHRTDTGRRTGRSFRGLYRARYFRDGVVGIRSELHGTLLVFEGFDGNSEVLFRGNSGLSFSGPQVVDDDRIAFVAASNGVRELRLYDRASGELFRIEKSCGNNGYWSGMRGLGVSEGKLFFSHNADDRMYRLAVIDLGEMRAVFSYRDFSGGVFNPVSVGSVVYYRGAFFARDRLLRFPEAVGSVSGRRSDVNLVRLDGDSNGEQGTGSTVRETHGFEPPVFQTSRYFGIRHMNPFRAWFPMPLIRAHGTDDDRSLSLDGSGLVTFMADPTQRNFAQLTAFADARYQMASIPLFLWQNTSLGFPLTLGFSDTVLHSGDDIYRNTRISLVGSLTWSLGRWSVGLAVEGGYVRMADYDGGASAYTWGETESLFFVSPGIKLSNRRRSPHELFGTGISLSLVGVSRINNFEPHVAGMFQATAETRFPVSLALFGAYDERGMNLHGVSRIYGRPLFSQFATITPMEYPHRDSLVTNWLGGVEAAMGLFFANPFFGKLAIRNVVYDSGGHPDAEGIGIGDIRLAQSLVFSLGLTSFGRLLEFPFYLEPSVWAAWNFSNTITGRGPTWRAGFGINLRL